MLPAERLASLPLVLQSRQAIEAAANAIDTLSTAAYVDQLTTLPNKAAMEATAALLDAQRIQSAVVFVDLSGFKELNDGPHGHDAGDAALRQVGKDLAMVAGAYTALAFRNGGDEFVLMVPMERLNDALNHLGRLLRKVDFAFQGHALSVSANVGYAAGDPDGTIMKSVTRADQACREAKSRADGQPLKWTADIGSEAPKSERRKCTCGATTTLLVSPTKRRQTAMTVCGNCQQPYQIATLA